MLTSVLDAKITTKLVRLGSRSSDERIAEYTLDKLEKIAGPSDMLSRPMKRQYAKMKELEEQMQNVMESIQLPTLDWETIEDYLLIHFPEHAEHLQQPPFWVTALTERLWSEEEEHGEWTTVGKDKKKGEDPLSRTFYGFWKNCSDIDFIKPRTQPEAVPAAKNKKKGKGKQKTQQADASVYDPEVIAFFESLGFNTLPPVPSTSRAVSDLLGSERVWQMSPSERTALTTEWERRIRELAYNSNLDQYNDLRVRYEEVCQEYNDMRDEVRSVFPLPLWNYAANIAYRLVDVFSARRTSSGVRQRVCTLPAVEWLSLTASVGAAKLTSLLSVCDLLVFIGVID